MGTIVSPVTGASFYHGRTIPVVYRSDTVDFDCAILSHICTISYWLDSSPLVNNTPISQSGAAPQTQAAYNITLPASGATATVDVEAWGVGGHWPKGCKTKMRLCRRSDCAAFGGADRKLNDTAQAIYNLVAVPVATCSPATLVTETTATLNGNIAGTLLPGGSARFVWGSPSPVTNASVAYVTGAAFVNLTGLTPGTTYAYRLDVLDDQGTVIASSGQCTFATNAGSGGGGGGGGNTAQLTKLCSITGVTVMQDCDASESILLVTVTSSDGDIIPTDSTEFPAGAGQGVFTAIGYYRSYYADLNGSYLNPQPTNICLPSTKETLTTETYRIAGTAAGTSTPSTAPASVPTVGNTVTITPPYRALSWVWLRQTEQDPGAGSVAKLTVNGFEYNAGNGPVYQTTGGQITADNGQSFNTTYAFTASGEAYVEITVIR